MKILPYRNGEGFCVAYGCPRNKFSPCSSRKVSFYRFPKDKDLLNKWTLSLKLSVQPSVNSVLCSNHFEPDCFVSEIKVKDSRPRYYKHLKKDAVPSIPAIQISVFLKPKSTSTLQLDDTENEVPSKFQKIQTTDTTNRPTSTTHIGRVSRTPLTSGNWNPNGNQEMANGDSSNAKAMRATFSGAGSRNARPTSFGASNSTVRSTFPVASQASTQNTPSENSSDKDDDVQVLRVYESLSSRAERQKNVVFRSRFHVDSRHNSRLGTRPKTERRMSTLDKTEDLEQHQRYQALLQERSSSLNSGYKNDVLFHVADGPSSVNSEVSAPKVRVGMDQDEYSNFEAEYPSSGSAEMIMQNAKYTTNWILNLEEKHKKSFREEMMKAEKTRELAQHLRKHNEKLEQSIEKKQWDWRSAFEIFKIEDESRALPTLTPEMEEEVKKALVPYPENEKLVSAAKVTITRKDVNTLRGLNWLNDEVINCYMDLIKERSSNCNGKYPKVLTFNTFFYPNLSKRGNAFLKRWNRKIDIFSYDMILAPIHEGIHWCLAQIDFRSKKMLYLDSMGGYNVKCLELFLGYFVYESKERNVPFNPEEWRLEHWKGNPRQRNGSDCGVFACTYAEFLSRDAKFTFDQSDMPFLRRKMVYELLHGLLPF